MLSRVNKGILIYGMLATLGAAQAMPAQEPQKKPEKPEAPAKRLDVPADSAAADSARRAARLQTKPAPGEDRLQLPDVLIYGQDRGKRTGGRKITISPDQVELVSPPALYSPADLGDVPRSGRQDVPLPDQRGRTSQGTATAYGGQYGQAGVDGTWWQALPGFDYGIEAAWKRRDGQFSNSQMDSVALGARLGLMTGQASHLWIDAGYHGSDYGLYGATLRGYTRERIRTVAGFSSHFDLPSEIALAIDGQLQSGDVRDQLDSLAAPLHELDNFFVAVAADFAKVVKDSEFHLRVRGLRDRVTGLPFDTTSIEWYSANLSVDVPLGARVRAEMSANFTGTRFGGSNATRLRPGLQLVYVPGAAVVLSARFSSGITYTPWDQVLDANPYFSGRSRPFPEEKKWGLAANLEWQLSEAFLLRARYETSRIAGYNYFQRDAFGTFAIERGEWRLGQATVAGETQLSDKLRLDIRVKIFHDAFRTPDGRFDSLYDIPYRGQFQVPVELAFTPVPALTITPRVSWIDARRTAPLPEAGRELSGFLYTGLDVSFTAGRVVILFGAVRNAINEDYDLWDGYQEFGAHAIAGLRAKW